METQENVCKILMLGSSKVGKTSILSRFLHGNFPRTHRATVQDFFKERIAINLALEIEEIGASHAKDNAELVDASILSSDIIIIVIALDDPDCIQQAMAYKNHVTRHCSDNRNKTKMLF